MDIGPSTVASGDTLTFHLIRTDDGDVTFADHDHKLFLDDSANLEAKLSEHDTVEAECLIKKAVWAHSGGTHMLFVEAESCSAADPDYMDSDTEDDTTATQSEPEGNTTEETQNQDYGTTGKPQTPATGNSGSPDSGSKMASETSEIDDDCTADEKYNELTVQPVEWDPNQPLASTRSPAYPEPWRTRPRSN